MVKIFSVFLSLLVTALFGFSSPSLVKANSVDLAREYPFGNVSTLSDAIGRLIGPAFSIAGTAVVIYFIWGSAKIVFSQGDKNEVAAARQMITHAIIGFVLLIVMFIIFQYLPQFLGFNFRVISLPTK